MAKGTGEKSMAAIGRRLRLTREALGLNQSEFAARAGIGKNAYNQYERGKQRPSIESAIAIAESHRVTLDWIYRGDNSGLRNELFEKIRSVSLSKSP